MNVIKKRKIEVSKDQNNGLTLVKNFGEILTENFPHIFEKIIRYAVEGDMKIKKIMPYNSWLLRVQKYGCVSKQWKAAILSSRDLFKVPEEYPPAGGYQGPDKFASSITCHEEIENDEKKLIEDGYLQVAKHLEISMDLPTCDVNFIRAHAAGNQIEEFSFDNHMGDPWSDNTVSTFEEIFKMSKKAHKFIFFIICESQNDAEQCWKLLNAAATCNDRQKVIYIERMIIDPSIDWSFTNQTAHTNTGLIKLLDVNMAGQHQLNFSHLGRIETMKINYTWFEKKHAFIAQMAVKELKIIIDLDGLTEELPRRPLTRQWRLDLFTTPHDESYQWPMYPATHKVSISYFFDLHYQSPGVHKEFTKSFECGKTLWENVRRWMRNVQYQLEQLPNIDESFATYYQHSCWGYE